MARRGCGAAAAFAALAALLGSAAPARAQVLDTWTRPDTSATRPDSVAWRPAVARPSGEAAHPGAAAARSDTAGTHLAEPRVKPFLVMMRSAIVPGWGQVYNRQPLKAAAVLAGEGFLTYKIFQELSRQNDAIDREAAATDSLELEQAVLDEDVHRNRKINWIWWTFAAHMLQMADAYVDAHFRNFDAEFGTDDAREGAAPAPRVSVAFRVRF